MIAAFHKRLKNEPSAHPTSCTAFTRAKQWIWAYFREMGQIAGTPLDILNVTLQAVSTLDPATLLPRTIGEPAHNCIQITEDLT